MMNDIPPGRESEHEIPDPGDVNTSDTQKKRRRKEKMMTSAIPTGR
jgi:hypothetical protein